jgi:UDP:flavonoid glycosyltransferase YjiC (YdhE family)
MKILVAPLNWGLGHATRCIPIIRHYLSQGDEVILGGDGNSLRLLQRTFPTLRCIDLPSLELRYTTNAQQRGFYFRAVWALMRFTIANHYYLRQALAIEHFDLVIADNRFGCFSRDVRSVYITHQLYPILPKRLRVLQPLARAVHACIYKRYAEVWVPDYADPSHNLSGALSHGGRFDRRAKYIGPLSRFTPLKTILHNTTQHYTHLALLSGLEPQRTIFEQELLQRFADSQERVLLVRGKVSDPHTVIQRGNITIIPSITDDDLRAVVQEVHTIIARSGYSTIMDLEALDVLHQAEFHPTPGQSEQEYLYTHIQD